MRLNRWWVDQSIVSTLGVQSIVSYQIKVSDLLAVNLTIIGVTFMELIGEIVSEMVV